MAGHVDPHRRVVIGDHGHGGGLTGVGLTAAIGDYLRRGLRLRDAGEAPVLAGGSKRARVAGRCAGDERARRSEVGLDGDVLWRGFSSERERGENIRGSQGIHLWHRGGRRDPVAVDRRRRIPVVGGGSGGGEGDAGAFADRKSVV